MLSTSSNMINIGCHTTSRWTTKCGYIWRRSTSLDPHRTLRPLRYGPYTITKALGNNAFELSIPPFLGLDPVFNVDFLHPYFPPLLDTYDIAEKITQTELNPGCMEHATTDCIMDMKIKSTR